VTYLLDSNVVSYFLHAGRRDELARAAQCCSMAVVEEVRQELATDKDPARKEAFRKWIETSNIQVRAIEVGSDASATLAQLLTPASSKDRGEQASIALAAFDDTLTFVTHDQNGLLLALRELWSPGERVLGLAVFLRRLFAEGALEDPAVLDDVISVPPSPRPTWWAAWRSGLVSRT
jgi:hypothetical protein